MPAIDVVVPTFDGWELTRACLELLAEQTVEHTVIVSDDGSTDGTANRVREAFPHALVVSGEHNQGFAAACNRGVAAGTGAFVLLLNNDVRVRPDFLEQLVAPLERDPGVGSVAALLLQPDEQTIDSVGLTADSTLAGFPRLAGEPVAAAGRERPVLVGPSGGAAAYRREAWEAVGGLDEAIFFYMEDLDLGLRLRAAGWRTAAAPSAVGIHLGSATIGARTSRTRYNGGFARGYLLRGYGVMRTKAAPRAFATEAIVSLADLVLARDAAGLRGRIAGWGAARSQRKSQPPRESIEHGLGFTESLRLRRRSL